MTTRFQFRHVNELAGLFVLLILVAAAVALFAAARSQHWFAATTEYKLQLPSSGASGLKPGNDIIVLGLPAGTVKDVTVRKDGRLDARIVLRSDFSQFIRADTMASIKKVFGVAGDSYVELSRGVSGEPLKAGAEIISRSSDEFPSMVDKVYSELRDELLPIVQKTAAGLEEWTKLGTNLNTTQHALRESLERINRIAATVEAGQGSAGRLIMDSNFILLAEQVLRRSEASISELQIVLKNVQEATATLPEVAENLRAGTSRLPSISRAVDSEAQDLPGLVLQVQQAAGEFQRLTEALQRHWLLRSYVEPRSGSRRIPVDQISGGTP